MAKGTAMGLWRGKKGSSVFYKISNSNSAQKQGIRERVYEVKNPQSAGQASQRLKMLPASRVYGALKEVIERSWQGVPYGSVGRNEFMKHALRVDNNIPFLVKGSDMVLPGAYQISKGTIQPLQYGMQGETLYISLGGNAGSSSATTWGEVSAEIIAANPNLKDGDQITYILFLLLAGDTTPVVVYNSIYIDTTDERTMQEFEESLEMMGGEVTSVITRGQLQINGGEYSIVGYAAIVSRNGTTPLRSSQTIALNITGTAIASYYADSARQRARASYMKSVYSSSNWPVDPDGEGGGGGLAIEVVIETQAEPSTGGSVTGAGTYYAGDQVTLVASEASQLWAFDKWTKSSDPETSIGRNKTLTFTASRQTSGTYIAHFLPVT